MRTSSRWPTRPIPNDFLGVFRCRRCYGRHVCLAERSELALDLGEVRLPVRLPCTRALATGCMMLGAVLAPFAEGKVPTTAGAYLHMPVFKRRFAWRLLFALAAILMALIAFVAVEFIVRRGHTPPITDAAGNVVSGSIASLELLPIGDVEQYVLIRGHDASNPVLLFLHGGPGMPAMYLAHAFQRELERDFVVVHWDRRGAGKSFGALRAGETPTVGQTLEDTLELTRHLRIRLLQDRIYLVGHSWGSYLGLLAIRASPEYYRAFVGMGQVAADAERTNAVRRNFVVRSAAASGDSDVVERIEAGGSVTEDDLFRYGGQLRGARSFWPLLGLGLRAPEYTLFDVPNVPRGAERLGREMRDDVLAGPPDEELLRFDVPVAFFLGRHDFNTPSTLAKDYFERTQAPWKRLVWFEQSAHFPFLEEPEKFHSEMMRLHSDLDR
jgi:pimeloyl-ACP methyl ester carboxylesterase